MAKIEQFEDLEIWQESVALAIEIFKISEIGKLKNDFGTKDQIKRAVLSISSNIAEGFEYNNHKEFCRYLKYAKGSTGELRSQLYVLYHIGYIDKVFYKKNHNSLTILSKRIQTFINYLKKRIAEQK